MCEWGQRFNLYYIYERGEKTNNYYVRGERGKTNNNSIKSSLRALRPIVVAGLAPWAALALPRAALALLTRRPRAQRRR